MAIEPRPALNISWADDAPVAAPDVIEPDLSAQKDGWKVGVPHRWWMNYWQKAAAEWLRWLDRNKSARGTVSSLSADVSEGGAGLYVDTDGEEIGLIQFPDAGDGYGGRLVFSKGAPGGTPAPRLFDLVTGGGGIVVGGFGDVNLPLRIALPSERTGSRDDVVATPATIQAVTGPIVTAATALTNRVNRLAPVKTIDTPTHKQWEITPTAGGNATEVYGKWKVSNGVSAARIILHRRYNGAGMKDNAVVFASVDGETMSGLVGVLGVWLDPRAGGAPSELSVTFTAELTGSGAWVSYRVIGESNPPL